METVTTLLETTATTSVKETTGEIMSGSLMTGMILLVVVFCVLLILSIIIGAFGKMSSKESKPAQPVAKSESTPKLVKKAETLPISSADDEDGAVAAAIAAAVAIMAPAGMIYKVRRITPSGRQSRAEWATAAIRQNTMPF